MIGAIIFELRALNSDSLPVSHGQLLHGLCFKILEDYSPVLADEIHNEKSIKPFTSAEFEFPNQPGTKGNRFYIKEGTVLKWRVTALQDSVLQAFLNLRANHVFKIGKLQLVLERVIIDPEICAYSGLIDPEDMLAECFSYTPPSAISMDFCSVTSFRLGNNDFPWPLPEYVFGSLADKWIAFDMPGNIQPSKIREGAVSILPLKWNGKSRLIRLSPKRCATGFIGQFTYSFAELDDDEKALMSLLAAYAELSGVGRWTAHGLGQVRIIR